MFLFILEKKVQLRSVTCPYAHLISTRIVIVIALFILQSVRNLKCNVICLNENFVVVVKLATHGHHACVMDVI